MQAALLGGSSSDGRVKKASKEQKKMLAAVVLFFFYSTIDLACKSTRSRRRSQFYTSLHFNPVAVELAPNVAAQPFC